MIWFILSLLSAISQSGRDLFSKRSLQSLNQYTIAFAHWFFSLPFLSVTLFFVEIPSTDMIFWLVVLVSSGSIAVASILYIKAIETSPLSLTVPMLAFTPLFLLITSPLILGEFPSLLGLAGIFLIVFGAYVLSIKDVRMGHLGPFKALAREKGSRLMLLVAIIYSIHANLAKVGIQHSNPLFFSTVRNVFASCWLLPLILPRWRNTLKEIRISSKALLAIGWFNALMFIFVSLAMELAIVPYVISVKRMTIFFSTLFGYFFFHENRIVERLIGAFTMVLGVTLMSF